MGYGNFFWHLNNTMPEPCLPEDDQWPQHLRLASALASCLGMTTGIVVLAAQDDV